MSILNVCWGLDCASTVIFELWKFIILFIVLARKVLEIFSICTCVSFPDVQDVFWTSYVRSIYVLCLRGLHYSEIGSRSQNPEKRYVDWFFLSIYFLLESWPKWNSLFYKKYLEKHLLNSQLKRFFSFIWKNDDISRFLLFQLKFASYSEPSASLCRLIYLSIYYYYMKVDRKRIHHLIKNIKIIQKQSPRGAL